MESKFSPSNFNHAIKKRCPTCPVSSRKKNYKYIHELPYFVRKPLCDVMDADSSWKELGGNFMKLNEIQLTLVSHALYRGASPTNDLLIRWEQTNPLVSHLFHFLYKMKHSRAMSILVPYVEDDLKKLCQDLNSTPDGCFIQANDCADISLLNQDSALHSAQTCCSLWEKSNCIMQWNGKDELEVPYQELLVSTDNFNADKIIGNGGFGVVYKGLWKGTNVAIKRFKGCEDFSQAITELKVLNQYRIDNILPLYGISLNGPEACLVYQFMINGSLEDRLLCRNGTAPLTWSQRASIGEGMAKALNYIHTLKGKPLVHGDVKSANVLLDAQFECKLGDFGLAQQISANKSGNTTHITVTSVHGTSVYLPSEYLRSRILSPAVDVYSYGIVMLEMATGLRAFDGKRLLLDKVKDEIVSYNNKKLNNLISRLRDKRIILDNTTIPWFVFLIKLGLNCAQLRKNSRPKMIQILDYYSEIKDREEIQKAKIQPTPSQETKVSEFKLKRMYDIMNKDVGEMPHTFYYDNKEKVGKYLAQEIAVFVAETKPHQEKDENNATTVVHCKLPKYYVPSLPEVTENQDSKMYKSDITFSFESKATQSNLAQTDSTHRGQESKNEDKTKVILPLITELGLNDSDANKLPN